MDDPPWLQSLGAAYLAGDASVFVLKVRDRAGICELLARRFSSTREIVGVVGEGGPTFPNLGDLSRFEQLWQARRVLGGGVDRPGDALARIWAVLEVATVGQGWILRDGEHLARAATGAPPLAEWATAPRIRDANHIVVVLATELLALPAALRDAARVIDAATAASPAPLPAAPVPRADGPVNAPSPSAGERPPLPPHLEASLVAAFADFLPGWPGAAYSTRAPFLSAIADVLHAAGAAGPITVAYDPEAGLSLTGDGAAEFRAAWSSDLALDAALGTLSREWTVPEPGFAPGAVPAPDPTGLRVLVRRLGRAFFAPPEPATAPDADS